MTRTLAFCLSLALFPIADDPAPPPLIQTHRFVRVTWEPGPGWPSDLLATYPAINFQCLVNSASHNPSVNPVQFPYTTYITNGEAVGVTDDVIGVTHHWEAIVMAGSKQFAVYSSNRLYKLSWTGMSMRLQGDVDQANLSTVMTLQYIGTPPL